MLTKFIIKIGSFLAIMMGLIFYGYYFSDPSNNFLFPTISLTAIFAFGISVILLVRHMLLVIKKFTKNTDAISDDGKTLLKIEKNVVFIVTSIKDIMRMYHSDIPEKIKMCRKNGGQVFLITDSDEKLMIPYIKRLHVTENKVGKLSSNGRITVFENTQMFMSDSTNTSDFMDENSDISLCTDAPEMINNIFSLCTFLWGIATPLKLK